nr:MAG TPA: hypothetical protein [Caudoviricetes sp.]
MRSQTWPMRNIRSCTASVRCGISAARSAQAT